MGYSQSIADAGCTPAAARPLSKVSVVVPTLDRHAALTRALASLQAQSIAADVDVEIVVVDNSPTRNAERVVRAAAATAPWRLHYVSAPTPGVATARNAGIAAASGDWIAFLDDDEEAAPTWLQTLLAVALSSGADAVFGPVRACAEASGAITPFDRYFSRRLNVPDGADLTRYAAYLGTNNSMFRRACLSTDAPFDTALDQVGGEDSLLLKTLVLDGRRFAWAADACVTEWVPAKRLTWSYVTRRKFLSGQIRTFVHRMANPTPWFAIALWMAVGAVQFTMLGIGAILARGFDKGRSARLQASAAGGLGKVLWGRRFRPSLYGRGLVS